MDNGGQVGSRGYIFQSIIALIESLERDDWDEIKVEPRTEFDKVDIHLYRQGQILCAIQVKSSVNAFTKKDVQKYLDDAKRDTPNAEAVYVYLITDKYTVSIKQYAQDEAAVKEYPFIYLEDVCKAKIFRYADRVGKVITSADLDLLYHDLFAIMNLNSTSKEPITRARFEAEFQRAIPNQKKGREHPQLPLIKDKVMQNELFVEGEVRSADLKNIEKLLKQSSKPLWLYGDSGIGKTELVLRFAATHPEYEYVFASYAGSINQTVSQNLFILPGFPLGGRELSDIERYGKNYDVFRLYAAELEPESRNLVLIIDGYQPQDYEKPLNDLIGQDIQNGFTGREKDFNELGQLERTGIRIILTTQERPQHTDIYNAYEIKRMSEGDLLDVMLGCFKRILPYYYEEYDVRSKLISLIRIAGYVTVYVTLIAWAMENSEKEPVEAIDTMLQTLDSDKAFSTKYSKETLKMQDHLEKILALINLSYQEKQVLAVLAMLPDEGIEYEFFQRLTLSNAVQLNKMRQQALEQLIDNHIIAVEEILISPHNPDDGYKEAGRKKLIRIFPIIADHAIKILSGKNSKTFWDAVKMNWVHKLLHYIDEGTLKDLKISDKNYKYLAPLAAACTGTELKLKKLEERFKDDKETISSARQSLLLIASNLSSKIGNYKDALEYIERAIVANEPSSESMKLLLDRMNDLGIMFFNGGKFSEAMYSFLNALQILNDRNLLFPEDIADPSAYNEDEVIESDDNTLFATIFNNIAAIHQHQGNYRKALAFYGKALAIRERVLGTEHPDTAATYNNMAGVFRAQGDYVKALVYYGKALAISERVLGTEHPDTAATYNNMAGVYEDQGDYVKALAYYGKALAIRERVLGTEHPDTAATYNNMAGVFRAQGDYVKALAYYGKDLAISERVLGTEHPSTATTYNNMAGVFRAQGDYVKALAYYGKALAIRKRVLGTEHPDTATTYNNMAGVYEDQGDYVKALAYYGKALAIIERVLGTEHPNTATTYNNMAGGYEDQGDYVKALEFYARALDIFMHVFGPNHPYTVATRKIITSVHSKQGNQEQKKS